jgi:hypothetical protein
MKKLALMTVIISLVLSATSFASLTREIWWDTNVGTIEEAWAVVNGDTAPGLVDVITSSGFGDQGVDYYVASISGYLVAPVDGDYVFYTSSDDNSELLLDGVPVASVAGWAGADDWFNANATPSDPIALTAGQIVAIDSAMNEGTGGDNFSIGWKMPGSEEVTRIPNAYTYPDEAALAKVGALSPADGTTGVIDAELSWVAPIVGDAPVYDVLFGTDPDNLEKVAEGLTETSYNAGSVPADLAFSTTYYWGVMLAGETTVASFTTVDPVIITSTTGDAQPVGGVAQLEVVAESTVGDELTYQWHRLNLNLGPITIPDADITGAVSSVLVIDPVTAADQGEYYCLVTSPDGAVASPVVFMDAQTGLIHQWTFNESADGVTIPDVVGGADATLINNNGAAVIADGQVTTGNTGESSGGGTGAYIDLGNGLISRLTQMTLEVWTTWGDNTQTWARVYDFGTSDGGEDASSGVTGNSGAAYFTFFPKNGGDDAGVEYRNSGSNAPAIYPGGGRLPGGEEVMITQVHDEKADVVKLYINGIAMAGEAVPFPLASIDDNNLWLGRSQWGDPLYIGSYNEVRIYDTALSAEQIAADYLAGPDALGVLPEPCTPDAFTQAGDLNRDCVYDLLDAAMAADQWLVDLLEAQAAAAEE